MNNTKKMVLTAAIALCLPVTSFGYQVGSFDINVLGNVYETYDDNITLTKTGKKDDLITNAAVGLSAKYEGKTENLAFTGRVARHSYRDYGEYDNTSEDFTLTGQKEFSPYDRATIKNTFIHAEDPASFEDEFGRAAGRYSYYRNKLNMAYSKDLSKQFTVIGRYSNDVDDYSRSGISDSMMNRVGVEADYIISSHTTVFGGYDFSVRDFDPGSMATINSLLAGARQYFSNQLFLDATTGVDFIKSYNDKRYERPRFTASLTDDIDETTRASVTYDKRYYTNASTQDLFDYWQTSANLSKRVFRRLGMNLSGFYGKGTYMTLNIKDTLKGASAGLNYDINDNIKANISYTYSKTTSNDVTRDYARNVVSTGLTYEF